MLKKYQADRFVLIHEQYEENLLLGLLGMMK